MRKYFWLFFIGFILLSLLIVSNINKGVKTNYGHNSFTDKNSINANLYLSAKTSTSGEDDSFASAEPDSEDNTDSGFANQDLEEAYVIYAVDGDTIKLADGRTVRYIGMNTPETKHPNKGVECFGQEASQKNKELVAGKTIKLEKDISETDIYGRLLRYVYVDDIFVNDYLVKNGYAYVSTFPPDVKYQEKFIASERYARENKLGLWQVGVCAEKKLNPESDAGTSTLIDIKSGDIVCEQNYYNCSDFSRQLEAQDVFTACGGVNNDVHYLDSDGDGRACETLPP